jgi:hypothetical protein
MCVVNAGSFYRIRYQLSTAFALGLKHVYKPTSSLIKCMSNEKIEYLQSFELGLKHVSVKGPYIDKH